MKENALREHTRRFAAATQDSRRIFGAIILLRTVFFTLFIFTVDRLWDLGTPAWLVSAGAAAGLLAATYSAFTRLSHRGFFTIFALAFVAGKASLSLLTLMPTPDIRVFQLYALQQHLALILGAAGLAALSTWFFWRFTHALTIEILALGAVFVSLFAPHRNYHFDTLQAVNSLAWRYGLSQLAMLVIVGACVFILLLAYFFTATLPGKPQASPGKPGGSVVHYGGGNRLAGTLLLVLACLMLSLVSYEIYGHHSRAASTLIRNGVGDENREGLSPLNFHSALGTSNQPAALVRLENDYSGNPFSPMLYFRESALSELEGNALVIGPHERDSDVSFTSPSEPFSGSEEIGADKRTPVAQSIYLLTNHKNAFAVDYPQSIVGLKLPDNTNKFKAAYRAESLAPNFKFSDLIGAQVGNPEWSPEVQRYYLKTHADPRYKELAEHLTAGARTPIEKAARIIDYLNKNAIYTLTPNHELGADEDPVAPFLFGKEKRGYCVHFAHAVTYMLRAVGIPSRIGTGYLTDLSQSKDGHILLRMSDRHAWAEVFIEGIGWLPFDVQPEHVETNAESPVDMKVLEELMGLLGPGEEILPEKTKEGERGLKGEEFFAPAAADVLVTLGAFALSLILIKAYLLFSWMLPAAPGRQLRRGYRAIAARLHDLGFKRRIGETREEFRNRVSSSLGWPVLSLTTALNRANYAPAEAFNIDRRQLQELIRGDFQALRGLPLRRRISGLFNPSCIIAALGGSRW